MPAGQIAVWNRDTVERGVELRMAEQRTKQSGKAESEQMRRSVRLHPIAHFKTITEHRNLVCKYCFRLGLYRQGLLHDLSKYSLEEFWRGARYYQGFRSPNDEERNQTGLSMAWLHHKGRNRHHFEYWVDWQLTDDGKVIYAGNRMPIKYVAEMFCDRVAASRIYMKERYTDASPYEYFARNIPYTTMHPDTIRELSEMLRVLRDEGETAAFRYVKNRLIEERKNHAESDE